MDGPTYGRTDKQTDGRTDGQTVKRKNGQKIGRTDRPTALLKTKTAREHKAPAHKHFLLQAHARRLVYATDTATIYRQHSSGRNSVFFIKRIG